ncbi:hypothetical protein RhiirA4_453911 [Rhizophagus irregularis]|uniref:Uncharacterized protein n=1 Tax=Rhizophagus irregularis TaxID=588596 RepID=A0A2I1G1J6_9GLOM|nr:hypothetical protein RhiirA4_453911 [Rhizophagus irregularis]
MPQCRKRVKNTLLWRNIEKRGKYFNAAPTFKRDADAEAMPFMPVVSVLKRDADAEAQQGFKRVADAEAFPDYYLVDRDLKRDADAEAQPQWEERDADAEAQRGFKRDADAVALQKW